MEHTVVEIDCAKMWMAEDGVCCITISPNIEITIEDAEQILAAQIKLTGGNHTPVLVDIRQLKSATREARTFGASKAQTTLALALLVASPVGRMVGNIFISFSRPPFPTRLFTSEDDAHAWLKRFIE